MKNEYIASISSLLERVCHNGVHHHEGVVGCEEEPLELVHITSSPFQSSCKFERIYRVCLSGSRTELSSDDYILFLNCYFLVPTPIPLNDADSLWNIVNDR